MVQNDTVKEEMINDQYLPVLQSSVYGNEEDKKHRCRNDLLFCT
jgi:hypothetical protein